LCFSTLLAETVFQITNRRPRPLLSFEIGQLSNDLKKQFGGKKEVVRLLEAYEAAWARLQHEAPGAPQDPRDLEFETALLDWLRYHRAMLIGELVPIMLRFLQANPHAAVLPAYQAVLVDEFQDLNKADQSLIHVLALTGSLTVVGDDNQSIYRFRHANPEGIRDFAVQHAGSASHAIEVCWRCAPNIVAMSNSLISHDPTARQTALRPLSGRPDASVHVIQHPSVEDEADALSAFIDQYLTDRPNLPPGQVLVLSPRRVFGNAVRDALNRRRRNAMSFFWEDALESSSAAEGFCLLTLLVNPTDRAAYRAWLGLNDPDGNTAGYRRLRAYAENHDLEPIDVCEQISAGQLTLPHTRKVVEDTGN
jgi:superfamily I DNA/RNA helicase